MQGSNAGFSFRISWVEAVKPILGFRIEALVGVVIMATGPAALQPGGMAAGEALGLRGSGHDPIVAAPRIRGHGQ